MKNVFKKVREVLKTSQRRAQNSREIEQWARIEYKKDWESAYYHIQTHNTAPNYNKRVI